MEGRRPSLAPAAEREFKVAVVVSDDLKGGWTNRWASEFSHRIESAAFLRRGFITGILWTSEPASALHVRDAVLTAIYRAEYLQTHPTPKALREMLDQEGYAMARAGCTTPALDADDLAYTRTAIAPHLDAHDRATVIACLFGDAAANALGYPPQGLSDRAGLALALHDARFPCSRLPCPERARRARFHGLRASRRRVFAAFARVELVAASFAAPFSQPLSSRFFLRRPCRFPQLRLHDLVGADDQLFQFGGTQRIELLRRDPLVLRHVRRRDHAVSFHQLRKRLVVALERQRDLRRRDGFGAGDAEHLAADLEDQVLAPLNLFGGVGQGQANLADSL